jgi:hypothetical protein
VAHTCDPNYSGGREQEDQFTATQGKKVSETPSQQTSWENYTNTDQGSHDIPVCDSEELENTVSLHCDCNPHPPVTLTSTKSNPKMAAIGSS